MTKSRFGALNPYVLVAHQVLTAYGLYLQQFGGWEDRLTMRERMKAWSDT
ncbi:uncharacterized protein METZ01_LOCUS8838 [marine metagenome]|uniref:Uncharacterized protein n=1 Tax=marine metagenome TaxID=408172 RepID=A0A381NPD4_9ZZZZ